MAFDLAELDTLSLSESGVEMPILNLRTRTPMVDEDGTPLSITLMGRHCEAFRGKMKDIQTHRAELQMRNQQMVVDSEAREREDIDLLVVCTRGWTLKILDGQAFPCNLENIRRLWNDARFRPLREQALTFIMGDANFLAPLSSKSDASPATSLPFKGRSPTTGAVSRTPSEAIA